MIKTLSTTKHRIRTALPALLALWLGAMPATFSAEAGKKMLKVNPKRDGDTIHFQVENLEATEVTATFELQLQNLKCSQALPYTLTLKPHQALEAFTLSPAAAGGAWNYSYTSRYIMGSSVAAHDDKYIYTLPYAPLSAFRVTQAYHGQFSHTGPDEYAIDFKMPLGTSVHAAREGVIVKVKNDSTTGGPDRKYENSANYILIRHADGTLANYAHLDKGGSVVKVGQFVQAGQLIGYSGNTGFSSGPHLHFSVFKTKAGAQRQTLPIRFQTAEEFAVTLAEGKTYKSNPEAKPKDLTPAILPALAGGRKINPATGSPGPKN